VQQDANYNVTALLDNNGNVVERYAYDPFGSFTVYDANWNPRGSSSYAWVYLFQGERYDATSRMYRFGQRDVSPTLGNFAETDPTGFGAGDQNLYRLEGNSPSNWVDPSGLRGVTPNGGVIGAEIPFTGPLPGPAGAPERSWFQRADDWLGRHIGQPIAEDIAKDPEGSWLEQQIPIWGSYRQAIHYFAKGDRARGAFYLGLAILDVITLGRGSGAKGAPKPCLGNGGRLWGIVNRLLNRVCFAAGTHLRTRDGSKPIEQFQVGDRLLTAPEDDVESPVVEGVVEAVVTKVGPVLELGVGGRTIKVTPEHPFWCADAAGWKQRSFCPATCFVATMAAGCRYKA